MDNEIQIQVDSSTSNPPQDSVTKKVNNPKSALSYSEIIQLRQNKQGSAGGSATTFEPTTTGTESSKYFCNNCNRTNHVYNNCRAPITSIGVIAFRCGETGPEFLMIRRRDSFIRWVHFIHNRYNVILAKDEISLHEALEKYYLHYRPKPVQIMEELKYREKLVYLMMLVGLGYAAYYYHNR